MNNWIDLPVIEVMEYFGGVMSTALIWARRYALIFGLVGLVWSGFKVMLARMTVKELWWDTFFKWFGFALLITLYPSLVGGFAGIGNEAGLKVGGGKATVIKNLNALRDGVKKDLELERKWANDMANEISLATGGIELSSSFDEVGSYDDFINNVRGEITVFSNKKAREKAKKIADEYADRSKYKVMFGQRSLAALESVLVRKNLDGKVVEWNSNLTNTYLDLDIFLKDAEGNDSYYISPSALLKVALFSGMVMWEKENIVFNRVSDEISTDKELGRVDKAVKQIAHQFSRIPQMVLTLLCVIVLIMATIFAEIQYLMTVIEYTIIAGLGAMFLPLMLFDGTKDIPKKLIPVFISFMVKFIVMTTCIMFVYSLLINNCIHTIADDNGMNLTVVGEIFFEAALAYVLTQNAPKIAQTILTGQPQLSMGEFVAGAGTALATAGGMKAVASGAARKAYNGGSTAVGEGKKMNAAAKAASGSLGDNATRGQKIRAAMSGAGAVARQDLKDRAKAGFEKFSKSQSSIPVVDKALQMSGFKDSPAVSGGAGGGGGSSAYGVTGQGRDGKAISTTSNPSFATATKYDEKTQSQRNMTHKEFNTEKMRQGVEIGSQVGEKMRAKIDAQNAKKIEQGGELPENLSGNERGYEK